MRTPDAMLLEVYAMCSPLHSWRSYRGPAGREAQGDRTRVVVNVVVVVSSSVVHRVTVTGAELGDAGDQYTQIRTEAIF